MANELTFKDIYEEVQRAIKAIKGSKTALVKAMINAAYLSEILRCDDLYPLYWLTHFNDAQRAVAPAEITGITVGTPPVVSVVNSLVNGDIVSIHNVVGMTEVNDRFFLVSSRAAGSIELEDLDAVDIVGAGYTAWTSGGTVHHRGFTITETTPVHRIIKARWPGEGDYGKVTPIGMEELENDDSWTNDNTGRPERFHLRKKFAVSAGALTETNQVIWYPGANQAYRPLRYWFEDDVARLSADTDIPLLPPQFHDLLISGAIMRLIENNVTVENAVIWPGIYRMQLEALRSYNRKFYQDLDPDDRKAPYML